MKMNNEDQGLNPLFTVIIPVRNRSSYLYHTLKSCINQDYENLEIIVSDDFSTDDTREMVYKLARLDNRIKYVIPNEFENVGMLENFEFALKSVKSGYVIALGGDDALMPNSISKMWEILNTTKRDVLTWPTDAFFYPCQKVKNGQLVLKVKNLKDEEAFTLIDSVNFLKRQSENLFYISDNECPMIYVKSVISTKIINRVKSRSEHGRFYSCSTPDGYSGIVIAGEVEDWVYYNKPLSLHGVSPTSQGLGYLTKSEDAKVHSDSFFNKAKSIPMHSELASQEYSPLITLMTADFLLTAGDLHGWPGKINKIDFKKLILNSIKELEDGLFPEDRISREIEIIKNIAIKQNLVEYFQNVLNKSYRNSRRPLEGNAISPRLIYLDANNFKVKNVLEATYFVKDFRNIYRNFRIKIFLNMFLNAFRYKFLSTKKNSRLLNHV